MLLRCNESATYSENALPQPLDIMAFYLLVVRIRGRDLELYIADYEQGFR